MKRIIVTLVTVAVLWSIAVYNNNNQIDAAENNAKLPDNQASSPATPSVETAPRIGFKAPRFDLDAMDGRKYSLAGLKGKPVVINFWASWCGPCRLEAPELVKLYSQYKDSIEVYAVNLTNSDSVEEAGAFAKEFGFQFPVLFDKDGKTALDYSVQAIPTTFFVNQEGIIVDQIIGIASPDTLAAKFKSLALGK